MTFPENCAVYEIMWKNIVELDRPQMTIWHMGIACWIPKATNTTQNMQYLFLLHCNNGNAKASQCYVYRYIACRVTLDELLQSIDAFKLITSSLSSAVLLPCSAADVVCRSSHTVQDPISITTLLVLIRI